MARYIVTGFGAESGGSVTATGILVHGAEMHIFSVWNLTFDPASATPVKAQIQSGIVDAANTQLADYGYNATLAATDIEYLT